MTIYEHDETAIGTPDLRWVPVLNDDIFCSPACGGKCKKSEYDNAVNTSKEVALQLGENWITEVFENLGWYWKVTKGNIEITQDDSSIFTATMQFNLNGNYYFTADDEDPRKAVQKVLVQLRKLIKKLENEYASSTLDPVAIELKKG